VAYRKYSWSEEEDNWLKANVHHLDRPGILAALNIYLRERGVQERPVHILAKRMVKLGIQPGMRLNNGKMIYRWTPQMDLKLEELVGTKSIKHLAKALNRTEHSIKRRIAQKGLKNLQGVISLRGAARVLKLDKLTVRRYAERLGQKWRVLGDVRGHKGPTTEQIAEIAKAVLENPDSTTPIRPSHFRRIASGDWDINEALHQRGLGHRRERKVYGEIPMQA